MIERGICQLTGLYPQIGADHGVDCTEARDDLVGAGIEGDNLIGWEIIHHKCPAGVVAGGEDVKMQQGRGDWNVPRYSRIQPQGAGFKVDVVAIRTRHHGEWFAELGLSIGDMDDVVSGGQVELRAAGVSLGDQCHFAIFPRASLENAPDQPFRYGRAISGDAGGECDWLRHV